MRDVNDDMDELFKKAGENYPLNTNSGDWNEVKKALQPVNGTLNTTPKKNKLRRLLWMLLLIPFTCVIDKYDFNLFNKKITSTVTVKKSSTDLAEQKNIAPQKPYNLLPKKALNNQPGMASPVTNNTNNRTSPAKNILDKPFLYAPSHAAKPGALMPGILSKNFSNSIAENNGTGVLKGNLDNTSKAGTGPAKKDIDQTTGGTVKAGPDLIKENIGQSKASATVKDLNKELAVDRLVNTLKDEKKNTPAAATDTLKKRVAKKAGNTKVRQQHLYVGIAAGPDFSTVDLQKVTKTGFDAGIIAGYTFNKRWSIETGFFLDKKYYYSEGKYFNTEKIPIPANYQIINADGSCKMIEIPLNIKYNFILNKKANWFAAAGISSYFMKKEEYGYLLTANGQMPWEHEYSYKNSSKNLASIINFSVGYSRNIGKTGTFRIEPYIKVPVKGVGIGSLPITSSGVNLGFTKNLF